MENGKTKKKLNVIDIIIIVVLIAAIAVAGYMFVGKKALTGDAGQKYYVSYYIEEVSDFVADCVEKGDLASDDDGSLALGSVVAFGRGESASFGTDKDGNIVSTHKEGYSSMAIVTEVTATADSYGITVGSTRLGVGHSMTLRVGDAKFYLRVFDIRPADEAGFGEVKTKMADMKLEVSE